MKRSAPDSNNDIYFADESLSVVDEWMKSDISNGKVELARSVPVNSSDNGNSRSGLGSKAPKRAKTQSNSSDILEAKLLQEKKKALRKESNQKAFENADLHGIVEDDLDESRAQMSVSLKQKKLDKLKKVVSDGRPGNVSSPQSKSEPKKPMGNEMHTKKPEVSNSPQLDANTIKPAKSETHDSTEGIADTKHKRIRKKTRSKQKNIRKDNRSTTDRPEHLRVGSKDYRGRPLTEETKAILGVAKN